jgi:ribosome recycling factor
MVVEKAARVDDVRRAEKEMEKVVEKGKEEVKKSVEGARRAVLDG